MAKKEAVRVLVTDAGGPVARDLIPMIARGSMLGPDQPVILHLLHRATDVVAMEDLWIMTVESGLRLLHGFIATTDADKACNGVEFAILIGKVPKKARSLRSEVTVNNFRNYKLQAVALEKYAAAKCKVLVIAYPADTLALTLKKCAPSIPVKNITCLTRSYHNCALGHISMRLNVPVGDVKNVIIWGNHCSPRLHLDVNHATVDKLSGEYPVREFINDDAWLNGEFIANFQRRAASSIQTRGDLGAYLIATGACRHIHDWVLGTPEGTWVSMGVFSDGSYNVPSGLIYSFPVTCGNGEWTIVRGLPLDEFSRKKMNSTVEELMKEQLSSVASIERHLRGQHSA